MTQKNLNKTIMLINRKKRLAADEARVAKNFLGTLLSKFRYNSSSERFELSLREGGTVAIEFDRWTQLHSILAKMEGGAK